MNKGKKISDYIWIGILSICSVAWMYPIFMILINSLKKETSITTSGVFEIPTGSDFVGLEHYVNALGAKGLNIRVVSMPSLEVFENQSQKYMKMAEIGNLLIK